MSQQAAPYGPGEGASVCCTSPECLCLGWECCHCSTLLFSEPPLQVLTSQRVTDVVLKAFNAVAASQVRRGGGLREQEGEGDVEGVQGHGSAGHVLARTCAAGLDSVARW